MLVSFLDLCAKDVVNIVDGQRLGTVSDIAFHMGDGKILSLTVPSAGKWLGLFGSGHSYVIPWSAVCKIGSDVILVQLDNTFFEQSNRE